MRLNFTLLFTALFLTIGNAQFLEYVFTYDDDDYPFINEVKLADMNSDGLLDYVTLGHQNRTITVAYHTSFFSEPNLISFESEEALRNLVLHDFDQDGDVDIICSAPFDETIFWWSNDGDGTFSKKVIPINDYNSLLFADMNGDGFEDVVANVGNSLWIYDFFFGGLTPRKLVDFDSFGFSYKALTTFDMNGDGLLEILTADAFDGIILYKQTSAYTFEKVELLPDVYSVEKLDVVDFNQDGDFDIVASSAFNGTCKIQINQGDNTFVEENISPQNERIQFALV